MTEDPGDERRVGRAGRARLLDHVGVVADELQPLRARWERLGFAPTTPQPLLGRRPDGSTFPLGQSSCHVVLCEGYVELTAVDRGVNGHHLDPWRRHGPGLQILAFGTDSAERARERAAAAGLEVTPAMRASRAIAYGERHGEARFGWFMVAPADSPEALLCATEHETPELVFQPEVQSHPNGAVALDAVILVVEEPALAARRFGALADGAEHGDARERWFGPPGDRLGLLAPAAFRARYPGVQIPRVPWAGAMVVRVNDGRALRSAAEAPLQLGPTGAPFVAPEQAGGVVVEFVPVS